MRREFSSSARSTAIVDVSTSGAVSFIPRHHPRDVEDDGTRLTVNKIRVFSGRLGSSRARSDQGSFGARALLGRVVHGNPLSE